MPATPHVSSLPRSDIAVGDETQTYRWANGFRSSASRSGDNPARRNAARVLAPRIYPTTI